MKLISLVDCRPFAPYEQMSCVYEAFFSDDVADGVTSILDLPLSSVTLKTNNNSQLSQNSVVDKQGALGFGLTCK